MSNYSGIYRIVNMITGRTYIGSSRTVESRLRGHRTSLSNGLHRNPYLQASWKKHGAASFEFEPLVRCDIAVLTAREQEFIDAFLEHDMALYNIQPSSDSRCGFQRKHTPETKLKMSETARKRSPEYLMKQRLSHLGKTHTPETIAKVAEANRHRRASASTKAKMRQSHLERYKSQDERDKVRRQMIGNQFRVGHHHTDASRENLRNKMTGNQHLLDYRHTTQARAKISASLLAYHRRKKMNGAAA